MHPSEPVFEAYGSEGWEFESLRVRSGSRSQRKFGSQPDKHHVVAAFRQQRVIEGLDP